MHSQTVLGTGSFLVKNKPDNKISKSEEKTCSGVYSRTDFLADTATEAEQSWLTEWGMGKSIAGFAFFPPFFFYEVFTFFKARLKL